MKLSDIKGPTANAVNEYFFKAYENIIYDPKTRKVAECGKYDTGKKMNSLGSLPDHGKLFAFAKGHGKYSSVFHTPVANKKDNHKHLEGTGEVIEAINKYCFDWYNRQK